MLITLMAGAAAGLLGSVLGIGGGVFLVPVLNKVLALPFLAAAAVSLVSVVGTSTAVSILPATRPLLNLRLAIVLLLASVIGAMTSARALAARREGKSNQGRPSPCRPMWLVTGACHDRHRLAMLCGRRGPPTVTAGPSTGHRRPAHGVGVTSPDTGSVVRVARSRLRAAERGGELGDGQRLHEPDPRLEAPDHVEGEQRARHRHLGPGQVALGVRVEAGVPHVGHGGVVLEVELKGDKVQKESLKAGDLRLVELAEDKDVEATLTPARGVDVGAGPGIRWTGKLRGGVVGLVFDARGRRPMAIPTHHAGRVEASARWSEALGLYPA